MTKFDGSNNMNPMGTVYHFVHPEHADLDLRIFRNMCLGKTDVQIATEQSCDCETVYASVGRLKEYIRSCDMFSLVEIFRYVFFEMRMDRPAATTAESVIDVIYEACAAKELVPFHKTREQFDRLAALSADMPEQVADELSQTVSALCEIFERTSFTEGVKIGYQLGKELTH